MANIADLTPAQFRERWPENDADAVTLLDVREPFELELARVVGALHIPMREVADRLAELPHDRPLVVMCHLGGRSEQVAQFLAAHEFEHVFNLRGGIDAWSYQVDRTVPRY